MAGGGECKVGQQFRTIEAIRVNPGVVLCADWSWISQQNNSQKYYLGVN